MKKHIALGLVASTLFLAGCCTSRHAVVWQYQTVGSITEVNKLATEGWVAAGYTRYVEPATTDHGAITWDSFLLKHPKQ
jgi:protein involved in sex pheromone biosynthesis